jgi:anti-anti-sigma regulatory factor
MSEPSSTPTLCCPPDLTIVNADDLKERFLALLAGPVTVDISNVRVVDSAGLQVLMAAAAAWRRRGIGWQWRGDSRALDDAIGLSGIGSVLGRQPTTSAAANEER